MSSYLSVDWDFSISLYHILNVPVIIYGDYCKSIMLFRSNYMCGCDLRLQIILHAWPYSSFLILFNTHSFEYMENILLSVLFGYILSNLVAECTRFGLFAISSGCITSLNEDGRIPAVLILYRRMYIRLFTKWNQSFCRIGRLYTIISICCRNETFIETEASPVTTIFCHCL